MPIPDPLPRPRAVRPIVIVGAGGITRDAHLPAYRLGGYPVAGLVDRVPARAELLAARFGVARTYPTLRTALRDAPADAVWDVAVPAAAKRSVIARLPEGAAVLLQKPLGETLRQARALRELCHRRGLIAAVNFQLRYAPFVRAAREILSRGELGTVHDMEARVTVATPWHLWPFFVGKPRVELLYHSIHYLDLFRSFLGEPRAVQALTVADPRYPQLSGTRSAVLLDYGSSVRATITANHGHCYGARRQESYLKWEASAGAVVATMGLLLDYPRGLPGRLEVCRLRDGEPRWTDVPLEGSWFPHAFLGTMGSLRAHAEDASQPLPTSVEDACRTMALVEAAYRACASGGVNVPEG